MLAALTTSGVRLLIASGADREYFPLLRDTVLSIRAQRRDVALGILDLGLDGEQRDWLSPRVDHVVRPAWDLDFPGRDAHPGHVQGAGGAAVSAAPLSGV